MRIWQLRCIIMRPPDTLARDPVLFLHSLTHSPTHPLSNSIRVCRSGKDGPWAGTSHSADWTLLKELESQHAAADARAALAQTTRMAGLGQQQQRQLGKSLNGSPVRMSGAQLASLNMPPPRCVCSCVDLCNAIFMVVAGRHGVKLRPNL